jgi:DNA-binding transcriptional regulator YiaG
VTRPLSDRIAALYRAKTGAKSSHGAQVWFANLLGVSPRAVQYWQSGENPMEGPALAFLEHLERCEYIP